MEQKGQNDKCQVTAVLCGTIQGDLLPLQIIYKGKTEHCHSKYTFPTGWHITHSPDHWSTEITMLQYIGHIIIPYVEIYNKCCTMKWHQDWSLRITLRAKWQKRKGELFVRRDHRHVSLLPLNTTDLLQPMDISVNKPVKSFLKDKFSQWYAKQLLQQCEDQSHVPLLDISLEPIDISMVVMKNISAKWFVKAAQCRLGDLHRQLSFCTCYYYYYTYKHTIIMGLFSIIM